MDIGMVLAGVGGQGVLSLAQVILAVAHKCSYSVLQSEIHGMSQRGGMVNAHLMIGKERVSSPVVLEGTGQLLIATEPLEALRYLPYLAHDSHLIISKNPLKTMDNYPSEDLLFKEIAQIEGVTLMDTDAISKELNHKKGGGMVLLGAASRYLPFEEKIWHHIIDDFFKAKGSAVVEKNIQAFQFGKNYKNA